MTTLMSLSADMGESFGHWPMGDDGALMEVVTSASVACGFHAGDPMVMARTVKAAQERGVGVGAHPGYRDLEGFGRRDMVLSPAEIRSLVLYQVGALAAFCRSAGIPLEHVKPHGQLYNRAIVDSTVAEAVVAGVADFDPALPVVASGGALAAAARSRGVPVVVEAYLDRRYADDGTLVSRHRPGSVLTTVEEVVAQARGFVLDHRITTAGGATLPVHPHTLVVHGDTPGTARLARAVKDALSESGVEWAPMGRVLAERGGEG
jgi:UPF0271 protein